MRLGQGRAIGLILSCAVMVLAPRADAAGTSSYSAVAPAERAGWTPRLPDGSLMLEFENLEGVMFVAGRLHGSGRDTTGDLVLDTGAGHLALDEGLAMRLGLLERASRGDGVGLASRPLPRLELGARQHDQVSPVMTVDADVVRRVTGRPALGLLGQSLFRDEALWIDFHAGRIAIIPMPPRAPAPVDRGPPRDDPAAPAPASWERRARASEAALRGAIAPGASAVPFALEGDGKIILSARVSDPRPPRWSRPIHLILDTGATKSVLFAPAIAGRVRGAGRWARLEGLTAPTLFGPEPATIARIPSIEVRAPGGAVARSDMDAAILEGELGALLSRATGRTIHGLLGYSFLRHFRVCIDYPHRVLWLEPVGPGPDDRPFEYSHPGLQIERVGDAVQVVAVATGSPAAEAGIAAGDLLVSVDGEPAAGLPIADLARRLEGEPGTGVDLVLRRGGLEHRYRIIRRQLL